MSEPIQPAAPTEPLFSVVRGSPTDEELAAVVAVLISRSQSAPAPTTSAVSGWSAYWRGVRASLAPGPGSWRASGRQ